MRHASPDDFKQATPFDSCAACGSEDHGACSDCVETNTIQMSSYGDVGKTGLSALQDAPTLSLSGSNPELPGAHEPRP